MRVQTLHSNLVIFKFKSRYAEKREVRDFTFQSGYIQIQTPKMAKLQYLGLYIPIWLYSNLLFHRTAFALQAFTFQSGYIQISMPWAWF